MAKTFTVVPAYGRDYKSVKAVKADWEANKDFTIVDFFSGEDGRAINKRDADAAGVRVSVRYDRMTKSVVI